MKRFNRELCKLQRIQETRNNSIDFDTESKDDSVYDVITFRNNACYLKIKVPDVFRKRVLVHVMSNYVDIGGTSIPPLYLAIEGRAGEGKTVQTIATCTQCNIDVLYLSASQLSGQHEREALDIMREIYNEAVRMRHSGSCVAIVIDDFHMSIVNQDNNLRKTVNSNLLTGYLMNLADGNIMERVPIILTGNSFSKVYKPLLRSGRADFFEWKPDSEVKLNILKQIMKGFVQLTEDEFNNFFQEFKNATIADFSQLINDCKKDILWDEIKSETYFDKVKIKKIDSRIKKRAKKLSYEELRELALIRIKRC